MNKKLRIDKFLTVCRFYSKRSDAKQALIDGEIFINDKVAKPSSSIVQDDIIYIDYTDYVIEIKANIEKQENKILVGYDIISKRNKSYISC